MSDVTGKAVSRRSFADRLMANSQAPFLVGAIFVAAVMWVGGFGMWRLYQFHRLAFESFWLGAALLGLGAWLTYFAARWRSPLHLSAAAYAVVGGLAFLGATFAAWVVAEIALVVASVLLGIEVRGWIEQAQQRRWGGSRRR